MQILRLLLVAFAQNALSQSDDESIFATNSTLFVDDDANLTSTSTPTTPLPVATTSVRTFSVTNVYFPLLIFVLELDANDTKQLENYVDTHKLAQLKEDIDEKRRERFAVVVDVDVIDGDNATMRTFDKSTLRIVEAYHNATILNALRCVWQRQLEAALPFVDQFVILHYFAQRTAESASAQNSVWRRLWNNFRTWIGGKNDNAVCSANEPICVRSIVESLDMEDLIELDAAASADDVDAVYDIFHSKVQESNDVAKKFEWDDWLRRIEPPKSLRSVVNDMDKEEKAGLQQLREREALHSLRDFYRAVIESRSRDDQEEMFAYFRQMNTTFARCYDPFRDKFDSF